MADESSAQPYAHPPITEVVLELRLGVEVPEAKLKKAHDWISKRYSTTQTEQQVEARFEFAAQTAAFVDKAPVYKLASADQTDQCVLGDKSLAWVRRSPYEGWTQFRHRFEAELLLAFKAIGVVPIIRIGLRYVNRIDVQPEEGVARYEDYLNFRIEHGNLLEPCSGYQWLVAKEFPESKLKAIVQSASVEAEVPGLAAFSFDIDVSCDVEIPQKVDDILSKLESMRIVKNAIFEAGISDRAKEMYA